MVVFRNQSQVPVDMSKVPISLVITMIDGVDKIMSWIQIGITVPQTVLPKSVTKQPIVSK